MLFELIKELSEERGKTISEVEREAGLSGGAICKWKSVSPRLSSIESVAKVLNVSTSSLVKAYTSNCSKKEDDTA